MAAVSTAPAHPVPDEPDEDEAIEKEIVLPEDLEIRASIMYAAGMSLQYKLFSKYPYQIDYKNQQITSLTEKNKDISKSNVEYVAAAKRDGKQIGELEEEKLNIRKWVLSMPSLLLLLAIGGTVIVYGNNNVELRNQLVAVWSTNAFIFEALAIVLVIILAVSLFTRRRKRPS